MADNLLGVDAYNEMIAAGMSEEVWLQHVKRASLDLGYLFYHTRQIAACPRCHKPVYCLNCRTSTGKPQRGIALGSDPGFHDTIMAKPSMPLVMAELKKVGGPIRPDQQKWVDVCQCVTGVVSGIFDPRDSNRLYTGLAEGIWTNK